MDSVQQLLVAEGRVLLQCVLEAVAGAAPRSYLTSFTDILHSLNTHCISLFSQWLEVSVGVAIYKCECFNGCDLCHKQKIFNHVLHGYNISYVLHGYNINFVGYCLTQVLFGKQWLPLLLIEINSSCDLVILNEGMVCVERPSLGLGTASCSRRGCHPPH